MNGLPLLPFYSALFILGIVIGSFLNVCIIRIPAGESIVNGPSHCPGCGKRLRWRELVPVFSFIFLKGKCSSCGVRISAQYPIVEAANGALWAAAAFFGGFNAVLPLSCVVASSLLVLAMIDARTQEIPDGTVIVIFAAAAVRVALDLHIWYVYAIGLAAISVPLLILFYATKGAAIGGGDIKLMAAAGLFLGWKLVLAAFFLACLSGSVIHLIRMKISDAERRLALGPYLAAGIYAAILWGDWLIRLYMKLFGLISGV